MPFVVTHPVRTLRSRLGLTDLPVYVDMNGEPRIMANLSAPGELKKAFPRRYADYKPTYALKDFRAVDRRKWFGAADWILDQNGAGSCVANGSTGALRRKRVLMGQPDVKLSPGCCYAQINGGSDNGAIISDALTALTTTGTVPYSMVGESPFYLNQLPSGWKSSAQNYRIVEGYHALTLAEMWSAVMNDDAVFFGIMVGRNWESFDKYGVCGHDSGWGNHCIGCDGCVILPDGRAVVDSYNSWAFNWGPWSNGRCYIDQQHIEGGGDQPDVCIITLATLDPGQPQPPGPRP